MTKATNQVIASMATAADVRSQLWLGLLSLAVVVAAYRLKERRRAGGVPAGRTQPTAP